MTDIRTVSRLAGVSVATVSRTFSQPDAVSEKTRQKVRDAAKAAGYRPNMMARNFRARRSYAVMVLVPNIANPFFSRVISGIERGAQARGYSVLLGSTGGDLKRERDYAGMAQTFQADGVIQLSARFPFEDEKQAETIPLVNICECFDAPSVPRVLIDNEGGANAVIEHLLSLGHKKIGIIKGPNDSPLTDARLRGCREALANAGLELAPGSIADGDFSMQAGVVGANRLMANRVAPTAIFCFNDEMAIGAMSQLRELGYCIPGDVSVVGFDDIAFAKFAQPPLTTVAQPAELLGVRGVTILADIIDAKLSGKAIQSADDIVKLPCELTIRRSTGVVRGG